MDIVEIAIFLENTLGNSILLIFHDKKERQKAKGTVLLGMESLCTNF